MTPFHPLLALLLLTLVSALPDPSRTTTLYIWPLTAASATPLAAISYNPSTLTASTTPLSPPPPPSHDPIRIGLNSHWTVTTAQSILSGALTLRLDDTGAIWNVEFSSGPQGVTVVPASRPGIEVVLNRPVVLDATGKLPVPEVEKTWLQKYWWVLLAGAVLVLGGGGGGE